MNSAVKDRESEKGSAGVKFVFVLFVIALIANAGINYIPVAYDSASLKSDMETAILQGLALPGKANPVDNVKGRIARSIQANSIPATAVIDVKQNAGVLTAHVTYSQPVNILPFGIYKYNYNFDYTATPTGFLTKQ
jgi:hypothetical protein